MCCGRWGIHGVSAPNGRRIGVMPGIIARKSNNNDDANDNCHNSEERGLRPVISASQPDRTTRPCLDDAREVSDPADRKTKDYPHTRVPGKVQSPWQPKSVR